VTFADGYSPADERAEAASRGSCVSIMEEAISKGSTSLGRSESGIAVEISLLGVPEREREGDGSILRWWLYYRIRAAGVRDTRDVG
jgi:hypothetical protein